VKDLRIFADRNLKQIVIADDRSYSYAFQPMNGIPICSYEGSKNDGELLLLAHYLKSIMDYEDLRDANREKIYT